MVAASLTGIPVEVIQQAGVVPRCRRAAIVQFFLYHLLLGISNYLQKIKFLGYLVIENKTYQVTAVLLNYLLVEFTMQNNTK